MGRDVFYVTSSIPYVNAEPHVGTAYEIIALRLDRPVPTAARREGVLPDRDRRAQHQRGRSSAERDLSPQEWMDQMVPKWEEVWAGSRSPTTTSSGRRSSGTPTRVQAFVQRLHDRGQIYLGHVPRALLRLVRGVQARRRELIDGNCPIHGIPVERLEEENYFFPLSKYQEPLLRLLRGAPRVRASPRRRRNEVVSFVRAASRTSRSRRIGASIGASRFPGTRSTSSTCGSMRCSTTSRRPGSVPTRRCSPHAGRPTSM